MEERRTPYFWVTWLCPLLTGEESCEFKAWTKGHYAGVPKHDTDFDSDQWKINHTSYLAELHAEYKPQADKVLLEDQAAWRIDGDTATVAGKMDLLSINPNLVVDAKTGKPKDAHKAQVKIYLIAIAMGALKGISGTFRGVLRYRDGHTVEVPRFDDTFKRQFFQLVRRLATMPAPDPIPSARECKFCDVGSCRSRIEVNVKPIITDEF